jgi:hypothetical protein
MGIVIKEAKVLKRTVGPRSKYLSHSCRILDVTIYGITEFIPERSVEWKSYTFQ